MRGFQKPGYACAIVVSFLVIEQVFAYSNPSFYLGNTKTVDIAIGILTLAVLAYNKRLSPRNIPATVWVSAFFFVFAGISISWSPDLERSWELYTQVIPLTILASFLAPLLIRKPGDLNDLLDGLLMFSIPMAIVFAFGDRTGRALAILGDFKKMELQPLASAQLAGYMTIIACMKIAQEKSSRWLYIPYITAAVFSLFTIVNSSSRGQLLALFPITLLGIPIVTRRSISINTIIAIGITCVIGYGAYYIVSNFDLVWRWKGDLIRSGASGRLTMIASLLEEYFSGGGGVFLLGLGSSASYFFLDAYCHNVPIEVLCETGIVGFALYTIIYVRSFSDSFSRIRSTDVASWADGLGCLLLIAFYDFLISFKQGSILGGYTFCCINILAMAAFSLKSVPQSTVVQLQFPLQANRWKPPLVLKQKG